MTKYESQIKQCAAPVDRVYAKLADLRSIETLKEQLSDPNAAETISQRAGDKVKPEQIAMMQEKVRDLQCDQDSVSSHVDQFGMDITLRIIEREEPKLVKMQLEGAPIQATLWIQLLPGQDNTTRMKLTLGVDMNFFIRQMIGGKLKDGVEQFAEMLARIPY
ncbi:MAG: SRPBCC family protein [Bacteroidales bacterium]|nr:SRPBCC family protein [Candidatus Physcousia equi]